MYLYVALYLKGLYSHRAVQRNQKHPNNVKRKQTRNY